jgi:hypothetical protein
LLKQRRYHDLLRHVKRWWQLQASKTAEKLGAGSHMPNHVTHSVKAQDIAELFVDLLELRCSCKAPTPILIGPVCLPSNISAVSFYNKWRSVAKARKVFVSVASTVYVHV